MRTWLPNCRAWIYSALLASALVGLAGCATDDPENSSARPWNTPKSWESGLPSSMMEGR